MAETNSTDHEMVEGERVWFKALGGTWVPAEIIEFCGDMARVRHGRMPPAESWVLMDHLTMEEPLFLFVASNGQPVGVC